MPDAPVFSPLKRVLKSEAPPAWTASTLYALASGHNETNCYDSDTKKFRQCFFCGGPSGTMPSVSYQSMLRQEANFRFSPGAINSDLICRGCHLSLRESCTVTMPPLRGAGSTGKTRTLQMSPVRNFSWVLTKDKAIACNSTGDLPYLREACLQPPLPPYAIVIASPGFHVMHEAKAVLEKSSATVHFQHATVPYTPKQLGEMIKLAGMVTVACHNVPEARHLEACENRFVAGKKVFETWQAMNKSNPEVAALAAFLCHPLEECRALYPIEARDEKKA